MWGFESERGIGFRDRVNFNSFSHTTCNAASSFSIPSICVLQKLLEMADCQTPQLAGARCSSSISSAQPDPWIQSSTSAA